MKRVMLSLVVFMLVVAPAMANISIPWQTNQYGTYQSWTQNGLIMDEVQISNTFLPRPTATIIGNRLEIVIPNIAVTDYVKVIELEVLYTGTISGFNAYSPGASSNLKTVVNNPGDLTVMWHLIPQPSSETVTVWWDVTPGPELRLVEVATICVPIPAPGAILLGSIGVGLVGWLRRRRSL